LQDIIHETCWPALLFIKGHNEASCIERYGLLSNMLLHFYQMKKIKISANTEIVTLQQIFSASNVTLKK
jgi:hypothetical protein